MKRILIIISVATIEFLALTLMSFRSTNVNINSWELAVNDSTIIKEFEPSRDTLIILNLKNMQDSDTIRYYYYSDVIKEYSIKLFLSSPQGNSILVSDEKNRFFKFGKFSVKRLVQIYDSCNCEYLELKYEDYSNTAKSMLRRTPLKLKIVK